MNCCPCITGLKIVDSDAPVPLKSIDVTAGIKGFVADVTAVLVYKNPENNAIEVIYKFPMDDSSAVYRFEAEVDGRTIIAECQEKQQAKQTYEDAVASGHMAAYMEEAEALSDIFQVKVGNIPANGEVKITFGYVTELKLLSDAGAGGLVQFVLYTLLNPRYNPNEPSGGLQNPPTVSYTKKQAYDFTFKATVTNTSPINTIIGGKDELDVKYNADKTQAEISLSKPFVPDHDLSLDISYADSFKPHVITERGIASGEGILKEDVLMLNFFPQLSDSDYSSNQEFIIIIDRSGSMGGSRIKSAQETLLLFLKSLPMGCYFNIIGFGSHFDKLFPEGSKLNSEESMKAALEYQKKLEADFGGTEILQPLQDLYSKPAMSTHSRQLFILTDGEVFNTNEVISVVRKNSHNTRVFSFGIGEGASTALVKGVARAGRGRAEFIKEGQRMQPIVMKTLKAAMQLGITDLELDWQLGGSPKLLQIPKVLPPLFSGDRLIVYAVSSGQAVLDGKVQLKGKIGERALNFALDISGSGQGQSSEYRTLAIHRLAAKTQIQQLQDEEKEDGEGKEVLKASIILLSTATNIVSHHTAMVAVDKEKSAEVTGKRTTYEVPQMLDPTLEMGRSAGFGGGCVNYMCAPMPMAACSFAAAPMMRKGMAAPMLKMSGAFGPPPPGAAFCFQSDECDSMEVEKAEEISGYMAVVQLQTFSGSWKLDAELEKATGVSLDKLRKAKPDQLSEEVWGTVVALAVLREKYRGERDEWEMIEMKAEQWIKTQNLHNHSLAALLDLAKAAAATN